jgi:hypothetical protein
MIGFTALLAICILAGSASWAATLNPLNPSGEPGMAPSSKPAPPEPEPADMAYISRSLKKLIRDGYVVDGPTEVFEVGSSSITLFTGKKKNWTVELSGKKALIKDYQGNTISLSNIQPKMKIYTCRRADNVTIFVLAKKEARNDQ